MRAAIARRGRLAALALYLVGAAACPALALMSIMPGERIPAETEGCGVPIIETAAGNGQGSFAGDGGTALEASLNAPCTVAFGSDGTMYVADAWNHRVRKVGPDGIITTVAGSGPSGWKQGQYSGDGGPATEANLNAPRAICVGADGVLYVADTWNHRIRKISPDGVITTVAGTGEKGHSGDGGPATEAALNDPGGVALGSDGSLYIADTGSHRIRRIDPTGIITTAAGSGGKGYSGDNGPAAEATLNGPGAVAVGLDGSLCVADRGNRRVRRIDARGVITTIAGNGGRGFSGYGGPATEARIADPASIALAPDGSIYIADTYNQRLRKVDPEGIITTVAGDGWRAEGPVGPMVHGRFTGDYEPATLSSLHNPAGLAVGPDGSVYVADSGNHRIRRIWWRPCQPEAARAMARDLQARAGDLPKAWREVVGLYLIAEAWDDAVAAAERAAAITPEGDETARLRAEILVASVYAAKRDDHEARRRLMRILARAEDSTVLREAADLLVNVYLLRGERAQAIATLDDLRLRTQDRGLLKWIDDRLKGLAGG